MIVKCSHCKAMFSEEDFEAHECDLPLTGCKTIEVTYILDVSTKNTKMISAQGIDGVLYAFEAVPRKTIPLMLPISDGISQRELPDEDDTVPMPALNKGGIEKNRTTERFP